VTDLTNEPFCGTIVLSIPSIHNAFNELDSMDFTILFVAIALAMDSFSVAITNGVGNQTFKFKEALKAGTFFGLFQAAMSIAGWVAGRQVLDLISGFDHWIAFGLLAFIGGEMIYESVKTESKRVLASPGIGVLLTLSVATSIDALAVGLGLSFLQVSIVEPAIVIGVVAFLLSFLGVYLGGKLRSLLHNRVEMLGGSILIAIGIRILMEHFGIV
jgi:putative Mn2+ efflux pump MntP